MKTNQKTNEEKEKNKNKIFVVPLLIGIFFAAKTLILSALFYVLTLLGPALVGVFSLFFIFIVSYAVYKFIMFVSFNIIGLQFQFKGMEHDHRKRTILLLIILGIVTAYAGYKGKFSEIENQKGEIHGTAY